MNAARRKAIQDLSTRVAELQADIEALCEEEQDYYDAMPESIQSGEKGSRAEEAIGALEAARDSLEDVVGSLDEAVQ